MFLEVVFAVSFVWEPQFAMFDLELLFGDSRVGSASGIFHLGSWGNVREPSYANQARERKHI